MSVFACSHPGDYGEERKGDGSPGCICPLVEWQLIRCSPRPLIGQEAETYKVQKGPETCQKKDNTQIKFTHKTSGACDELCCAEAILCSPSDIKNSVISLIPLVI